MSVSDKLESQLQQELESRIDPKVKAGVVGSGALIAIILPALIDVLSKIMAGCNNTPELAASKLKQMGPWTRANLRRGIRKERELNGVRVESQESIQAVVEKNDESTFVAMITEHDEEAVDWAAF